MNQLSTYAQQLQALAILYLPRVLMAGVVLVVGWWLIGWASRVVAAAARRLDGSLASFLTSLVNIVLKLLLLISVAGMAFTTPINSCSNIPSSCCCACAGSTAEPTATFSSCMPIWATPRWM